MPCDHKLMRPHWKPNPKQKKCWKKFRSMISRIPLASFVAFLMCVVGVVAYSGSLYRAIEYLLILMAWHKISQVVWLIMIVHIVLASLFLIVAALSTGDTRKEVCTRCVGCNFIGRCSQITMIVLAYTLHLLWLILPCVMLIVVALMTGLVFVCQYVPDCIHLRDYGLTARDIEQYGPEKIMATLNSIDEDQIQQAIIKGSEIVENTAKTINRSIPTNLGDMLNNINISNFNLDEIKKHIPPPEAISGLKNQTEALASNATRTRQRRAIEDHAKYLNYTSIENPEKYLNYSFLFADKLPISFTDINVDIPSGTRLSKLVRLLSARAKLYEQAAEKRHRFLRNRVTVLTKMAENVTDVKSDVHRQLNATKAMAEEASRMLINVRSKADVARKFAEDADYASASGAESQAKSAAKRSKAAAMELYALFHDMPLLAAMDKARLAEKKAKETVQEAEKRVRDAFKKANETFTFARSLADPTKRKQALQQAEALQKIAQEARSAADRARREATSTVEKYQQTVLAIAEKAGARAASLAAEATKLANSTVVQAANRTLFKAMAAASDAAKKAQEVAREAQARAEAAAVTAQEAARKAAEVIGKEAKEKAEEMRKAAEAILSEAKSAAMSARQQAEKAVAQAQETVQAVAKNAVNQARKFAEQARASAEATVKAAAERVISTVMETANKAVEVAQKAAAEAMKEAKKAAKRAEEIAKTVAQEADKVLREKAKEAEKFAREIASRAMHEAEKAMREAHNALEQAEKTIKAVAEGAIDLAKEYAAKAEQAARFALREAQKTAREVRRNAKTYAKMMTQVRAKVNEIYRIVVDVSKRLDIKMESGDRVCSGAKRIFCAQIKKAHVNLCICAAASIIINLSMVHFLMAMSANYVHITQEFEKARESENDDHELKSVPDESSEFIT